MIVTLPYIRHICKAFINLQFPIAIFRCKAKKPPKSVSCSCN